jgi:glucokinase
MKNGITVTPSTQQGESPVSTIGVSNESYPVNDPLLRFSRQINGAKAKVALAADIGATKTDMALVEFRDNVVVIIAEKKYHSRDYTGIEPVLEDFLKMTQKPERLCLGVAGPVLEGQAKMANLGWVVDRTAVARRFEIPQVSLINDLEATAYGLAMVGKKGIHVVHAGNRDTQGNAAVIAPGTGLGEAGIYCEQGSYFPFATEGGHGDFAPRDEFDFRLHSYLREKFGHVSWERLISGPGIVNIYNYLRDSGQEEEPVWLSEKCKSGDAPAIISAEVNSSKLCRRTMELFIRYLAFESANLVLKFKATGGLIIGGGIAPQIVSMLDEAQFFSSFRQMGRLEYMMDKIPVSIIMNAKAALLGSAYYALSGD